MSRDVAREQRSNERYCERVAAVHRGAEGIDPWAAQCIAGTVSSTVRRHIAEDLRGMCAARGWQCTGDAAAGVLCRCEVAASVAGGAR